MSEPRICLLCGSEDLFYLWLDGEPWRCRGCGAWLWPDEEAMMRRSRACEVGRHEGSTKASPPRRLYDVNTLPCAGYAGSLRCECPCHKEEAKVPVKR